MIDPVDNGNDEVVEVEVPSEEGTTNIPHPAHEGEEVQDTGDAQPE